MCFLIYKLLLLFSWWLSQRIYIGTGPKHLCAFILLGIPSEEIFQIVECIYWLDAAVWSTGWCLFIWGLLWQRNILLNKIDGFRFHANSPWIHTHTQAIYNSRYKEFLWTIDAVYIIQRGTAVEKEQKKRLCFKENIYSSVYKYILQIKSDRYFMEGIGGYIISMRDVWFDARNIT